MFSWSKYVAAVALWWKTLPHSINYYRAAYNADAV